MRIIKIRNTMHLYQLEKSYIDAKGIQRRHGVSRATAYRYLKQVSSDELIECVDAQGGSWRMAAIVAIDRLHARKRAGNPQLTTEHQQAAAQARWK